MTIVDNVQALRPALNTAQMLRELADEIEEAPHALNVIVVVEREDHEADVRAYGPLDCPYRLAGLLSKAVRDVLP